MMLWVEFSLLQAGVVEEQSGLVANRLQYRLFI